MRRELSSRPAGPFRPCPAVAAKSTSSSKLLRECLGVPMSAGAWPGFDRRVHHCSTGGRPCVSLFAVLRSTEPTLRSSPAGRWRRDMAPSECSECSEAAGSANPFLGRVSPSADCALRADCAAAVSRRRPSRSPEVLGDFFSFFLASVVGGSVSLGCYAIRRRELVPAVGVGPCAEVATEDMCRGRFPLSGMSCLGARAVTLVDESRSGALRLGHRLAAVLRSFPPSCRSSGAQNLFFAR